MALAYAVLGPGVKNSNQTMLLCCALNPCSVIVGPRFANLRLEAQRMFGGRMGVAQVNELIKFDIQVFVLWSV